MPMFRADPSTTPKGGEDVSGPVMANSIATTQDGIPQHANRSERSSSMSPISTETRNTTTKTELTDTATAATQSLCDGEGALVTDSQAPTASSILTVPKATANIEFAPLCRHFHDRTCQATLVTDMG